MYIDNRELPPEGLSNGQVISVMPDIVADFRDMPFESDTFSLVLYDPPHLTSLGKNSWMAKKYGVLDKETWESDIRRGFDECMRVLKTHGTLVMKWSIDKSHPERSIRIPRLLKALDAQPLFGDRPGSGKTTYWLVFMKV